MKNIIIILSLFFFTHKTSATNYYISNSGNDTTGTGISMATPWRSIAKLNTVIYVSGDSVLFKAGNIFRGTIIVNQSGIVFTSYGVGNKPVISGAELVTNWNLISPNYYQANFSKAVTSFFVNNKEQTLARYPNEHRYLTFDSSQYTYLIDYSLTGSPIIPNLFKAGKVCIHTSQWSWEKSVITSVVGNKISFATPVLLQGLPKYAYFLYDTITHLDTIGEWFHSSSTNLLSTMSLTDPNILTCEASVDSNGIQFASGITNIIISNLAFEKQTKSGISIAAPTNKHIKIDNCYFSGQYNHGVNDKGKHNEISNCYFRDIDGIAVYINATGSNSVIHHNTFRNIGQFRNNGIGMQINLTAINCAFVDSCYIHHNDIDSAGYCGISVDGAFHTVERNIIKHAMLANNDGAALKSYGFPSHDITFKNNFVSSSDGNREGTFHPDFNTPAIYFDFLVNNCVIKENTIYDRSNKGIFLNSGTNNNTIIENVIYGANYGIDFNKSPAQSIPMDGMYVTRNSIFAKDTASFIIRMVNDLGGYGQGLIDSNYYFQPYNANNYAIDTSVSYTFANWRLATPFDTYSKSSFVNWTLPTSDDTLFINPTDNNLVVNLGTKKYLDLDSTAVCGNITLLPYTSKILINTNTNCAVSIPYENEFSHRISVFPNPCLAEFRIQNPDKIDLTSYEMYDAYGRLVLSGKYSQNNNSINIQDVAQGVYFIIFTGTKKCILKLIKE